MDDPTQWCQADTGAKLNLSETVRVTHQATSKHKFRYSFDNTRTDNLRGNYTTAGAKHSPEAAWRLPLYPTWFAQARWTAPITNRLLLEAGYSYQRGDFRVNYQPENPIDAVSKWDLAQRSYRREHLLRLRQPGAQAGGQVRRLLRHRLAQHQGRLREPLGQCDSGERLQRRRRDPLHVQQRAAARRRSPTARR